MYSPPASTLLLLLLEHLVTLVGHLYGVYVVVVVGELRGIGVVGKGLVAIRETVHVF